MWGWTSSGGTVVVGRRGGEALGGFEQEENAHSVRRFLFPGREFLVHALQLGQRFPCDLLDQLAVVCCACVRWVTEATWWPDEQLWALSTHTESESNHLKPQELSAFEASYTPPVVVIFLQFLWWTICGEMMMMIEMNVFVFLFEQNGILFCTCAVHCVSTTLLKWRKCQRQMQKYCGMLAYQWSETFNMLLLFWKKRDLYGAMGFSVFGPLFSRYRCTPLN